MCGMYRGLHHFNSYNKDYCIGTFLSGKIFSIFFISECKNGKNFWVLQKVVHDIESSVVAMEVKSQCRKY